MSLTPYLKKRLVDLLEEKRVVVWYDSEKAFEEVARAFADGARDPFLYRYHCILPQLVLSTSAEMIHA